jgi:hypothetical protein
LKKKDDEMLSENHVQAPRLYTKNGFLYVVITNEILCEFDSFIEGFFYLSGLYFVYDLKYPDCFRQLMGIFHEFMFSNFKNVDVSRNTDYMNIVSCITKKI